MRLVTFEVPTPLGPRARLGAQLPGGKVLDLHLAYAVLHESGGRESAYRLAEALVPPDLLRLLEGEEASMEAAREALDFYLRKEPESGPRGEQLIFGKDEYVLRPPLRPGALIDFFAFEDHAKAGAERRGEPLAKEWYELPAYYKGNHREIYGPGDTVPWPSYTRKLDYELEVAVVIGRKGRDLTPEEAPAYIAGYCLFNDFSARDIQKKEMVLRMGPAKGKDFANALGPALVTPDEAGAADLKLTARINGETWSQGNLKDQYWGFPLLISHLSADQTLYPGDVLGSGTFYKGCGLDLNRWLKPGDLIELEGERLGTLANRIGAPRAQRQLDYSSLKAPR